MNQKFKFIFLNNKKKFKYKGVDAAKKVVKAEKKLKEKSESVGFDFESLL